MIINVNTVYAFSDAGTGGNPAGVVLEADKLSSEQKLSIAQQAGLSETAFVSHSNSADFKLDFFTPTRQIAHCGHATIATFNHLHAKGLVNEGASSKETIDGNRDIVIRDGCVFMQQLAPSYEDVSQYTDDISQSLNISPSILASDPIRVSTGNGFLIVPLNTRDALANLTPNQSKIEDLSETLDLVGFYVFNSQASTGLRDASTRMFAPRFGIEEEAATGMAAGPLACYFHDICKIEKQKFLIEQGHFQPTPSPSIIEVNLIKKGRAIESLIAGGNAYSGETIQARI